MIIKEHLPALNRKHSVSYALEGKIDGVWTSTICHSYLLANKTLASQQCIEERCVDKVSPIVGEKRCAEVVEWLTLVHKCFAQWIDCALDEMLHAEPDHIYIRMDTSKMPGGVLLGILNCFRGVEEQWHWPFALSYVSERFPDLNDAQKLVISTMVHPAEYLQRIYNQNHGVWLACYATNLSKLTDFSFLNELVEKCMPFSKFKSFSCKEESQSLPTRPTMFTTMLPSGCFMIRSPIAKSYPGEYTHVPLQLSKSTIEYLLDSNDSTVKGVELHAQVSSPW